MNNCSNCYNGCAEITSDKCVRYTGVDVPILGIQNGDSLSYVEQALITFLTSTLDGTGIIIDVPSADICALITSFLPSCGPLTASTLFDVLIKSICSLQTQVTANSTNITSINTTLATLNANYDVSTCLSGVTSTSGTHAILQAVITKLCALNTSLPSTYVALSNLNSLIAAYLESIAPSALVSNKMVPFVVYPYLGDLTGKFDGTGAGIGNFVNIYICNGLHGTLDLRGVTLVGDTTDYTGATYNSKVNPGISGNPSYDAGSYSVVGNNTITLAPSQIPQTTHNHTITDPGHSHGLEFGNSASTNGYPAYNAISSVPAFNSSLAISSNTTSITINSHSLYGNGTGDGGAASHNNIQPSVAVYYIIYIPS